MTNTHTHPASGNSFRAARGHSLAQSARLLFSPATPQHPTPGRCAKGWSTWPLQRKEPHTAQGSPSGIRTRQQRWRDRITPACAGCLGVAAEAISPPLPAAHTATRSRQPACDGTRGASAPDLNTAPANGRQPRRIPSCHLPEKRPGRFRRAPGQVREETPSALARREAELEPAVPAQRRGCTLPFHGLLGSALADRPSSPRRQGRGDANGRNERGLGLR